MEGLRRGHRQRRTAGAPATCRHPALGGPDASSSARPGRRLRDLAQPVRLLPLARRRPRMRRTRRRPRPARRRPRRPPPKTPALSYIVPNACHDGGELPCEPGQPAGPAAAEAFLRDGRAGDRSLGRLQRRRPDRDHLCAGAADRPESRHQRLLRHAPNTRTCPPRRRPPKPPPARSNRPAAAARSGCCCSRPSSRRAPSTKPATTTTSRCCSASRNCSAWNRSATRRTRR